MKTYLIERYNPGSAYVSGPSRTIKEVQGSSHTIIDGDLTIWDFNENPENTVFPKPVIIVPKGQWLSLEIKQ